jgi:hypothetical protein
MRRFASLLLLGVALAAGAADVWRWKDANGVTHYSDQPVPGAERVTSTTTSSRPPPAPLQMPAAPTPQPAPQPTAYTRCEVTSPQDDATFFAVNAMDVAVAVEPALQPMHRLKVYLNGVARDWPPGSVNHTLVDLNRGSYKLEVVVVDERQRPLCNSSTTRFHIQQPSVLSPARQAPKPPPKPAPKPLK